MRIENIGEPIWAYIFNGSLGNALNSLHRNYTIILRGFTPISVI